MVALLRQLFTERLGDISLTARTCYICMCVSFFPSLTAFLGAKCSVLALMSVDNTFVSNFPNTDSYMAEKKKSLIYTSVGYESQCVRVYVVFSFSYR